MLKLWMEGALDEKGACCSFKTHWMRRLESWWYTPLPNKPNKPGVKHLLTSRGLHAEIEKSSSLFHSVIDRISQTQPS